MVELWFYLKEFSWQFVHVLYIYFFVFKVVAIRKQMIPWADEVMSNVLLLAGIETQIYADLQKDMPSVKL